MDINLTEEQKKYSSTIQALHLESTSRKTQQVINELVLQNKDLRDTLSKIQDLVHDTWHKDTTEKKALSDIYFLVEDLKEKYYF